MNFINSYHTQPTKLINGYLPRKVEPVHPVLSVPSFMKKNNPIIKPTVKRSGQSFEQILAEANRVLEG